MASEPTNLFLLHSTPLFLLRRLIFERYSTSIHILFLDWSQAFDSIGHSHLKAALLRYGDYPLFAEAIMALYNHTKCSVSDLGNDSHHHLFGRGIKQGCLSFYILYHYYFSSHFRSQFDLSDFKPRHWHWIWWHSPDLKDSFGNSDEASTSWQQVLFLCTALSLSHLPLSLSHLKNPAPVSFVHLSLVSLLILLLLTPLLFSVLHIWAPPDVAFSSQASHAFKCLDLFFRNTPISPKRKLQVSKLFKPSYYMAQNPKFIDSLHYKAPGQICHIKSPYHILQGSQPSDAPCSDWYFSFLLHIPSFLHWRRHLFKILIRKSNTWAVSSDTLSPQNILLPLSLLRP